jgi:acyl-CoA synthetase (AMP-forming)/AMP-acid ligase II
MVEQPPVTVNIASFLPQMARRLPGEPAVVVQRAHRLTDALDYRVWTFRELEDESNRLAMGLCGVGITRGMRTALMVKPSLEFFGLVFALFKIGAVPVLIDPGMGLKNLKDCLGQAEPEAFIGIPQAHVARVVLGWARESLKILVTVGPRLFWGGYSTKGLERLTTGMGNSPEETVARVEADEVAAILFTSGSTGVPKGAVYTYGIFLDQVQCLRELYGIAPGERDLSTFPLFALFGPALGMTSVVPDMDATRPAQANPVRLSRAIQDWKCTNLFASPALLDRLGRWAERSKKHFHTLKRAISAGAPASPENLERFQGLLKAGAEVFTPYGATEALPVCSIGTHELLGETADRTAEGAGVCVGHPAPRAEVRVIRITDTPIERWSDDLRQPVGEIGEVVVKGPRVTREYYKRPDQTALAKIPDPENGGFYHRMGDVGYFDEQGRLWFCGRKAHRVETANGTLFTIPCERVFNTHPQVARTALVGVGEPGHMRPVLCVELERPGNWSMVAIRQLTEELLDIGARYPHTRGIRDILVHPGFPVDIRHNAKIFREKLAVWAREKMR